MNGIIKKARSTFFPKDWTPQQVVDAINEAYNKRIFQAGNTYQGTTSSGIDIVMYLYPNNKIISAFPIE